MDKKKIVFTVGRFQGMTIGHKKIINKMIATASATGAVLRVYVSANMLPRSRNPLTVEFRINILSQIFPNVQFLPTTADLFSVVKELVAEGFSDIMLVVGQDRIIGVSKMVSQYIKPSSDVQDFKEKTDIVVEKFSMLSAGDRNDASSEIEGASGTKMRAFVANNDYHSFVVNFPSSDIAIIHSVFNALKNRL